MSQLQLVKYIRYARTSGLSEAQILHVLQEAGWGQLLMEAGLDAITGTSDRLAILEGRNIVKTYDGDTNALNGVSFAVKKGESVAVIGKSGSGKSTLMHILATLDRPTSGELFVDGRPLSGLSQTEIDELRNKKFGFVFQQFFLNGRDTCLENITLPLTIMSIPRKERMEKGMEMLKAIGLEEKAHKKAVELSGGQKQRLCIGRALINQPEVIFADEPTGNLDSENSKNVITILLNLQRERGITLILVTHDPDLAVLCDRTITIKDGSIVL